MPKARNPDTDRAEALFRQGMKLIDIAKELNLPEGTIRRWKFSYKWDSERSDKKKANVRNKKKQPGPDKRMPEVDTSLTEPLNDNQRMFCEIYANNRNATMAYIQAYGANKETANTAGPRLMVDVRIRAYIEELLRIKRESIFFSQDDLIEKQMRIAFADITDYVMFGQEVVPVMGAFGPIVIKDENTGEKIPVTKLANMVKFKESFEVDGSLIKEVKMGKDGASIKLADQQKAMDWLANYFMLNPNDKHKHEFDRKRLDQEERKLALQEKAAEKDDPDQTEDDGFLDAMSGQVDEIWQE